MLADMAAALAREEDRATEASAQRISQAIKDGSACFLVAEREKNPVGMAMFYSGYDLESAAKGVHLADLYVNPAARRQGVARQLIKAVAEWACTHHHAWMSLTVLSQNEAAKALYLSLGLQQVEVQFLAIGPTGLKRLSER